MNATGKFAVHGAGGGKVVWRARGGGEAAGLAASCAVTFGVLFLCLQIIHLKTPEDGLQKVREPFPPAIASSGASYCAATAPLAVQRRPVVPADPLCPCPQEVVNGTRSCAGRSAGTGEHSSSSKQVGCWYMPRCLLELMDSSRPKTGYSFFLESGQSKLRETGGEKHSEKVLVATVCCM